MFSVCAVVRSGGLDLSFRFWTWAMRILCGLPSVFLYTFLYDAVGHSQHAIHKRCEAFVLDGMFHHFSSVRRTVLFLNS